jgi:hypothetical protein
MKPLNYRTQADIDGLPAGDVQDYLNLPDIDNKELLFKTIFDVPFAGGPGGPVSSVFSIIANGAPDDTVNIHGAKDTVTSVPFAGTNDVAYMTIEIDHLACVQDMELMIDFSLSIEDTAVNNRNTYMGQVYHTDSGDSPIFTHKTNTVYVRDDNSDYDTGIMSGQFRVFVSAGDKIYFEVKVKDAQTDSGAVTLSNIESQIQVKRITYA